MLLLPRDPDDSAAHAAARQERFMTHWNQTVRPGRLTLLVPLLGLSLMSDGCGDDDKPSGGAGGASAMGGKGGAGSGGSGSGGAGSGGSGSGGSAGSGGAGSGGSGSGGSGGSPGSGGSSGNDGGASDAAEGGRSDMGGGTEGGQADGAAGGMSFFVTSTGSGAMGGNLGGLAGADAKCEMLAAAVGAGGKGWKAYLSIEAAGGMPAVNAKDRIGAGPWRNQAGNMVAADVTALLAGFAANLVRDEKGGTVPGNQHDILSGSNTDGTVFAGRTCGNWATTMGQSQVGHSDGANGGRLSAHASGCTQAGLIATAGAGRMYCFASTP
jgi:hypothetical protein